MKPDETPAVRYGRRLRRKAQAAQACMWFALCDNKATTTQSPTRSLATFRSATVARQSMTGWEDHLQNDPRLLSPLVALPAPRASAARPYSALLEFQQQPNERKVRWKQRQKWNKRSASATRKRRARRARQTARAGVRRGQATGRALRSGQQVVSRRGGGQHAPVHSGPHVERHPSRGVTLT